MTNVMGTIVSADPQLHMFPPHVLRQKMCRFTYRMRSAGADVDDFADSVVGYQREPECTRDVAHVDEIANLIAVFIDHRRTVINQPRRENGQNTGRRIQDELPWTIRIEYPQGDCIDSV